MTASALWAALDALPWPAPWIAHTFEVDCPCPNGADCGNPHTCEEVEAPEAYPASPERPAEPGRGQCVVQIATPGLEKFAKPCAEFIAMARNELPAIRARLRKAPVARTREFLASDDTADAEADARKARELLLDIADAIEAVLGSEGPAT